LNTYKIFWLAEMGINKQENDIIPFMVVADEFSKNIL